MLKNYWAESQKCSGPALANVSGVLCPYPMAGPVVLMDPVQTECASELSPD